MHPESPAHTILPLIFPLNKQLCADMEWFPNCCCPKVFHGPGPIPDGADTHSRGRLDLSQPNIVLVPPSQ